jgi:hypothetical protein
MKNSSVFIKYTSDSKTIFSIDALYLYTLCGLRSLLMNSIDIFIAYLTANGGTSTLISKEVLPYIAFLAVSSIMK